MAVTVRSYTRIDEAARDLSTGGGRVRVLGGGTILMAAINAGQQRFDTVFRITDPAMKEIRNAGDQISIGSAVTMSAMAKSPHLAFLAPAAMAVGGPAIRNMATVGGNLYARPPYGDLATALLALDASVVFASQPDRPVSMESFLRDRDRETGRLVAAIRVPRPREQGAFRWLKVSRIKPKGVSVLSIAANLPRSPGGIRIALSNMGQAPIRAQAAERALDGKWPSPAAIDQAVASCLEGLHPASDALASDWYRKEVAPIHLRRLLTAALQGSAR